jgi:hypothetical protein
MMRRLRTAVATLVAAIGLASALDAQQPDSATDPHAVQPERPTVATHAGTVAPGWLEIEAGVERDRFAPASVGVSTPVVLKFGAASHVQLSVFGATVSPPHATLGMGDAGVGLKWRLADGAPLAGDFAIFPAVKFPTGSPTAGTGTGTTDGSILLISSHDFGGVAMDLNVGYTRRSGDGSVAPRSASLWTASFGGPFGGPFGGAFGWVAECYGYPATGGASGVPSIVALLGGPTFLVRPWLAIDAGVIVPLAGPQPRALYAGTVYNVGRILGLR